MVRHRLGGIERQDAIIAFSSKPPQGREAVGKASHSMDPVPGQTCQVRLDIETKETKKKKKKKWKNQKQALVQPQSDSTWMLTYADTSPSMGTDKTETDQQKPTK